MSSQRDQYQHIFGATAATGYRLGLQFDIRALHVHDENIGVETKTLRLAIQTGGN